MIIDARFPRATLDSSLYIWKECCRIKGCQSLADLPLSSKNESGFGGADKREFGDQKTTAST